MILSNKNLRRVKKPPVYPSCLRGGSITAAVIPSAPFNGLPGHGAVLQPSDGCGVAEHLEKPVPEPVLRRPHRAGPMVDHHFLHPPTIHTHQRGKETMPAVKQPDPLDAFPAKHLQPAPGIPDRLAGHPVAKPIPAGDKTRTLRRSAVRIKCSSRHGTNDEKPGM